jgi:CheY-like chemotaxis protein/HPt (histidine-containing phosphotransfer) domain-containing protein
VASDGREALAALRDEAFDLVFMDCQMPEMDGFEAVRRFRASAAHGYASPSDTPVVALTANALAGDAERCLAAGFNDYLAKPVRREQLDAALARWAPGSGSEAQRQEAAPIAIEDPAAPKTPVSASMRVIDPTVIDLIRDMERRGSSRLLERLVATYISTAGKLVEKASYALKVGDAGALQLAVHTLKSSSANLGAIELSRRFAELERLARSQDLQAAQDEWNGTRIEYERAVQELTVIVAAEEAVMPN